MSSHFLSGSLVQVYRFERVHVVGIPSFATMSTSPIECATTKSEASVPNSSSVSRFWQTIQWISQTDDDPPSLLWTSQDPNDPWIGSFKKIGEKKFLLFVPVPTSSTECDPTGRSPHEAGAKLDAGKPRVSLLFHDMPRALLEVARVATYGANKYSAGGWQWVPNGIERYTDAMSRHLLLEHIEVEDSDSGMMHEAHVAWNALARLELILREKQAILKRIKPTPQ